MIVEPKSSSSESSVDCLSHTLSLCLEFLQPERRDATQIIVTLTGDFSDGMAPQLSSPLAWGSFTTQALCVFPCCWRFSSLDVVFALTRCIFRSSHACISCFSSPTVFSNTQQPHYLRTLGSFQQTRAAAVGVSTSTSTSYNREPAFFWPFLFQFS
jgi:hypothetical protein